jgi:hypothetical protein
MDEIRVTRWGEKVSSIGRLFTFGSFFNFQKRQKNFWHFFPINFDRIWVGQHFWRFSHKLIWSPWTASLFTQCRSASRAKFNLRTLLPETGEVSKKLTIAWIVLFKKNIFFGGKHGVFYFVLLKMFGVF